MIDVPSIEAVRPSYGLMVETCRAYGISRSKAFELDRLGLIETFRIGKRRFVKVESLNSLPDRLAARDAEAHA